MGLRSLQRSPIFIQRLVLFNFHAGSPYIEGIVAYQCTVYENIKGVKPFLWEIYLPIYYLGKQGAGAGERHGKIVTGQGFLPGIIGKDDSALV